MVNLINKEENNAMTKTADHKLVEQAHEFLMKNNLSRDFDRFHTNNLATFLARGYNHSEKWSAIHDWLDDMYAQGKISATPNGIETALTEYYDCYMLPLMKRPTYLVSMMISLDRNGEWMEEPFGYIEDTLHIDKNASREGEYINGEYFGGYVVVEAEYHFLDQIGHVDANGTTYYMEQYQVGFNSEGKEIIVPKIYSPEMPEQITVYEEPIDEQELEQVFTDIAHYGNDAWKGHFSESEIKENIQCYVYDFMYAVEHHQMNDTMKFLIENLEEDARNGEEQAGIWADKIKAWIKDENFTSSTNESKNKQSEEKAVGNPEKPSSTPKVSVLYLSGEKAGRTVNVPLDVAMENEKKGISIRLTQENLKKIQEKITDKKPVKTDKPKEKQEKNKNRDKGDR